MKVVQMARSFAALSETFLYTELFHLRRYKHLMLTRKAQNLHHFPGVSVQAFAPESHGVQGQLSQIMYRGLRLMSPYERDFFCRAAEAAEPDLFHVHYVTDMAYFAPVTRRFHLPVVVEGHGYDVSSFPRRYGGLGRWYVQRAWGAADLYLAMSSNMRADMIALGCPAEKTRVYYRGINLQRFPDLGPRPDRTPVRILFVGRLDDAKKGVEYLLRGFAALARERPKVELRLVGAGRFRERYERLAGALGVADRTPFAGYVSHVELIREYGAAHIFCAPSVVAPDGSKEGIPGTVVEAMATGLPIVTSRHAGIPEMVVDGEHGFLVAERDVSGIAQCLQRLVDNAELRARFGRAAAHRARERGDAVRNTAVLETIYDDLLAIHAGRERRTRPASVTAVGGR